MVAAETPAAGDATELPLRDELDLRFYFALDLPPVPGTSSNLGSMCTRIARGCNPKTKELPTPFVVHPDGTTSGAAWTEILDCSGAQGGPSIDAEDAFIAYIDARRCLRRVRTALEHLSSRDVEVLAAHYGSRAPTGKELGTLTPSALAENRARAAANEHQTVAETVTALTREAKDRGKPKDTRESARLKLAAIRRESAEQLAQARASYRRSRAPTCVSNVEGSSRSISDDRRLAAADVEGRKRHSCCRET